MNFQSLELRETTREFQQSVCENVNTNLTQLEKDVEVLKDWIRSQPHLPQISSDTMLKSYILACKNRMERAKKKIENYYIARTEMPDLFSERDPTSEKIKENAELIQLYTLPKLTPDGYMVALLSFTSGESKKFDTVAYSKRVLMAEDIKMNRAAFTKGTYYIFDGRNLSMGHVMKITPSFVRQIIYCAQDVLPVIIRGVIFINAPNYLQIVLNIMKPFMKSKLFQRIHVHTDGPEALEKYFPKALLPKDYGGEEDTSDNLNESWMKCLRENRDWFLNEGQLKADVNKNKMTSVKNGEFQEMQGSFKTLCID